MTITLDQLHQETRQFEHEFLGAPEAPPPGVMAAPAPEFPRMEVKTFEGPFTIRAGVSPDCSFRLVQEAVSAAKHEVFLYIYNISADYLIQLLTDRIDKGVKVSIMYDATDTRGDEVAKLKDLEKAGAKVTRARSGKGGTFTVCHQKFAVIDGKTLLIESANWATSSIPKPTKAGQFKKGNREWLLRIEDQQIAAWFRTLFDKDVHIPLAPRELAPEGALAVPELPILEPIMAAAATMPPPAIFDFEDFKDTPGTVRPVISPQNYREDVLKLISGAQHSIEVQQQYILSGGGVDDILGAMKDRIAKGVTVRVMVSPAFKKAWDLSLKTLQHFGVGPVKALNLKTFTHLHNKGVIVDGESVVVSSTNWSENSITRAREAGVIVKSKAIAGYFQNVFNQDWDGGWKPDEVPAGVSHMMEEAFGEPGGHIEIHPADLR